MFWRVRPYLFILIFNIIIALGIGLIKKDSKNQIKLLPDFFELYKNNEKNNLIELKEGNEEENNIKDEIKRCQYQELKNEINYLKRMIKDTDEKLSKENQNNNIINIENLDEILDLKIKDIFDFQPINFKTKEISSKNDVNKEESANRKKLELEENGNYPTNSNKLFMDSNKKEDPKKENESLLFNGEYKSLFNLEDLKNDINFDIPNYNGIDPAFRKDSFVSDLSNIENLNNLIDSDQFFE